MRVETRSNASVVRRLRVQDCEAAGRWVIPSLDVTNVVGPGVTAVDVTVRRWGRRFTITIEPTEAR